MTASNNENPNRYIGALVIALFGAYWIGSWSVIVFGRSIALLCAVAGFTALLTGSSLFKWFRVRDTKSHSQRENISRSNYRMFWIVAVIEAIVIYVLTRELMLLGYSQWIPAGVIFVVGMHFIPLSCIFRFRFYVLTGGALILIAVAFPLLARQGPSSPGMLLSSGLVLWITTLRILVKGFDIDRFYRQSS